MGGALAGTGTGGDAGLHAEIRSWVLAARERCARRVNAGLVLLYWRIGRRIGEEVLGHERAEYGRGIIEGLAARLTAEFGAGFRRSNLFRMVRFAQQFPREEIVATLSRQLGWSHFVTLLAVTGGLAREYYAEMCRVEGWSVRTLRARIHSALFERTAISRQPEALARRELAALREEDRMSPDLVFRDPYLLDFLGLQDAWSEQDLEQALVREMERFLLELGGDFAFLARQFRIPVDGLDHRLDLLFFHRRLRCLVAIELKLGRFRAADMGQMELYLRWLERDLHQPGEDHPLVAGADPGPTAAGAGGGRGAGVRRTTVEE